MMDQTGRSTRRGMPSARGLEWRKEPGDGANIRYAENYDKIPRNPDGSMRVESDYVPVVQDPSPPRSCMECSVLLDCPEGVIRKSDECRKRVGL